MNKLDWMENSLVHLNGVDLDENHLVDDLMDHLHRLLELNIRERDPLYSLEILQDTLIWILENVDLPNQE